MKKITYIIWLLLVCIVFAGCKKETEIAMPLASLNVTNALSTTQNTVEVNTLGNGVIYSSFPQLSDQSSQEYNIPVGNPPVNVVLTTDTLHPFFKQNIQTVAGGIYSLYLYGQNTPEALLIQDHIPAVRDSSAGMRFINLSPDSGPVTVNFQGSSQAEFSNLGYKQISDFKLYNAKSSVNGSYVLEIRDAASGNLLLTYTWNFRPFRCQTLVFSGLASNTSQTVFSVNNF